MTTQTPLIDEEELIEAEPTGPTWPPGGRTGEWWMFWQEDHPNTPPLQLLGEAVAYFSKKYGPCPNRAAVPLSWGEMLANGEENPRPTLPQFPGVVIQFEREILKGHLWLTYLSNGETQTNPPPDQRNGHE